MKDETKVAMGALALTLLIVLSVYSSHAAGSAGAVLVPTPAPLSKEGQVCLDCHAKVTADVVHLMEDSKHIASGVDCFTCHDATDKPNRSDAIEHYGFKIIPLLTIQDCQGCHAHEIPQRLR